MSAPPVAGRGPVRIAAPRPMADGHDSSRHAAGNGAGKYSVREAALKVGRAVRASGAGERCGRAVRASGAGERCGRAVRASGAGERCGRAMRARRAGEAGGPSVERKRIGERKDANLRVKRRAVRAAHLIAAPHAANHGGKWTGAGISIGISWTKQGLNPHHPWPPHLIHVAMPIGDHPMTADELC